MSAQHDLSVLVVDDDEVTRDITIAMLESLGVRHCEQAADGRIAIRQLHATNHLPDLVITDIYMPEMDGFELISALADGGFDGSVVLCSGKSVENLELARDVAKGIGVRLVGCFVKPLSFESLEEIVHMLRAQ